MRKLICVTGCLGFIGVHLTKSLLEDGHIVIGVDKISYASSVDQLSFFEKTYKNFKFVRDDINNLDRLYDCDIIINTAAETHVDNSIERSDEFVHSNVEGVHHLLKLIKNKQGRKPVLIQFSTDEVYGDIEFGEHTEFNMLKPSNPYAATKAAADMLITAWGRTYNLPYIIVRPTNNYGTHQYVEKLIPKTCKYLFLERQIPLHQQGTPRRTWLHVSDTVSAIKLIIDHLDPNKNYSEIYNISGNYEDTNINVVCKIIDRWFKTPIKDYYMFLDTSFSRPGQDVRYAIDDGKLKLLGWWPKANFDNELRVIVDFYKNTFIW